jgi:uncharacterized protein YneF (UPF0154 family)
MEVLAVVLMGLVNLLGFVVGAKIGMAVKKDKEIKLPSVNPVEAVKEHINKREAKIEQDKIDKIMQNIERYDGTPNGQVDVG